MDQFIAALNQYFGVKAPQLPVNIKEIIVKIAPYLAVIGVIVSLPAIVSLLGLSAALPFMMYGGMYGGFGISVIVTIVVIILEIIAIPGLFKRNASGWNFSFYSVLVSALGSLLRVDIIGLVLGLIIGFYFLFQVKAYYFGGATISSNPPQKM